MTKVNNAELNKKCGLHNRFDIEVVNSQTGEITQKAYAENIICNSLWARLLAPNTYFNYIAYGTGTGTPAVTDTTLFTHLGMKAVTDLMGFFTKGESVFSVRHKVQLIETEQVGQVLTEVGIAHSNASTSLVTHALIKDIDGNPISITKTNIDIINIYATVYVHWNIAGYPDNSVYLFNNYVDRNDLGEIRSFALQAWLAGKRASPPTQLLFCVGDGVRHKDDANSVAINSTITYNVNNRTVLFSGRLPAATGNTTMGFQSVGIYPADTAHVSDVICDVGGSWYPYTSFIGEAIGTGDGVNGDFKTVFPFVQDGAKIYVNGVEQISGVTVYTNKPNQKYIEAYCKVLEISRYSTITNGESKIPVPGVYIAGNAGARVPTYCIFENPFYLDGMTSIEGMGVQTLYWSCSDDLITWTAPILQYGTISISADNKNKRYWKFDINGSTDGVMARKFLCSVYDNFKNIHFDTPPAVGAVITADYKTKTIAKDANHVFDFSLTISLGELTEAQEAWNE